MDFVYQIALSSSEYLNLTRLAPVVQKLDSAIGFPNTYSLDSNLSGG